MKALVKEQRGSGTLVVKDIPEPEIAADQIKVKVHAAGICGTDLHIMKEEYPYNLPIVMGHEYSGTVVEVGSSVSNFKPGDRVVSHTAAVTCGSCEFCRNGTLIHCKERLSIGSGINGAFAQYLAVPARIAFKIPEGVSLDEAALCEPLAVVTRSVFERSKVLPGQIAVVSGPGPIGLLALQLAKAAGARVVVLGTSADKDRLNLAQKMGALTTIMVDCEDIYTRIQELTDGKGFDIAYECSGAAASADTCLHILKRAGCFVQIALYGKVIPFDHDYALIREINIRNGMAHSLNTWDIALRLLQFHQVELNSLITGRFPLEDWEKAFDMAMHKKGLKVLFLPNS